ncbi:MAG: toll/interleukin-1 receptor domain-containing protein [Pyrinomonadaceae bacterium]
MAKARKEMRRIFLSYASVDKACATLLRKLLAHQPNLRIFTNDSLSAGENWESKLKSELTSCDLFVVLVSPASVESDWVLHELGAAWGLGKPIVAVTTHPEVSSKIPVALSEIRLIDIKDIENPDVINQILEYSKKSDALETTTI